jgi:hypothetical protein
MHGLGAHDVSVHVVGVHGVKRYLAVSVPLTLLQFKEGINH